MLARKFLVWFSRCCLFLFIPVGIFAQTHVSGPVEGIWTSSGNPYYVDNTLIVLHNTSLILNPGVELYFNSPDSIRVYGTLLVQGEEGDSVLFRNLDTTSWRGIWFLNGSGGCVLNYASISAPLWGVQCVYSQPMINNCTILAKTVGIKGIYSDFEVINSIISVGADSASDTKGIELYHSDASISGSRIYSTINPNGENAFGIWIDYSEPQIIYNMIFVYATGMACGIQGTGTSKSTIRYNLIQVYGQNICFGISLTLSSPNLLNNTIAVEADLSFPAKDIYLIEDSDPLIQNCILFGDGASEGVVGNPLGGNEPLIRYCDFYNHSQNVVGCSLGVGCLLENPLFVNLGAADFRLMRESSCIDAGNPLSPPDPDLTRADMGCFYFDQTTSVPPPPPTPVNFALFDAFPNPFNAQVELVITLPQAQIGQIAIYNQAGRLVHHFPVGLLLAGENRYVWDPLNLSSSIYWAELRTEQGTMVQKLNLVK